MPGLLDAAMQRPNRLCRYNPGALELLMGSFALAGLKPKQPRSDSVYATVFGSGQPLDGRLLALKVWRCPVCGYVEFVDDEDA